MNPDDIVEKYSESEVQIRMTEHDKTVFVQGTRDALLFLSALFAAQAEAEDDSFYISPHGPGKIWFTKDSTIGIYIHRENSKVSG